MDFYDPQRPRPLDFAEPYFNFRHPYLDYGGDFSAVVPENPEEMTAYRLRLVDRLARDAGFELDRAPLPGLWSGCSAAPIGTQDILIFRKRTAPSSQAPLSADSANGLGLLLNLADQEIASSGSPTRRGSRARLSAGAS